MAMERIGLGGVLTFDSSQAVQATDQASSALGRFTRTSEQVPPAMGRLGLSVTQAFNKIAAGTKKIGAGIKQMGMGLAQAAAGLAPLTIAMGVGVNSAAQFEKQIDAVSAITRASSADMERLTAKAKQMGIESVFSATQSAEAMEFMGRAGASTDEIIGGLSGVMAAAAAESIDLATAADLVAQATKIMGREWNQASNTADILALTSAKTNTNMIALGEALTYGGQSAAAMGYTLEETASALGLMANAGLRGSIGGTSLMNMFNKLNKPSTKGAAIIKKWGINLTDATGRMKPMAAIIKDFKKHVDRISSSSERAAVTAELFGIRGQRAFQALSKAGPEAMAKLHLALRGASDGIGAAQEAANKRLDNFLGAFTLFKSSVESLSIGIFGPLLSTFQGTIQKITGGLNSILFALEDVRKTWNDLGADITSVQALEQKHGRVFVQIAVGIQSAIETIKSAWNSVTSAISALAKRFGATFGPNTIATITKWVVLIGLAAGAVAPLLLAFVTLGFAISGITTAVGGLITVFSGALSILSGIAGAVAGVLSGPVLLAVLAVTGAVYLFWDQLKLIWQGIRANLAPAFQYIGSIASQVWGEIKTTLAFAWSEISVILGELFGAWKDGSMTTAIDWIEVGKTIVAVITTVVTTTIQLVGYIVKGAILAGTTIFKALSAPFIAFKALTNNVFNAILLFMEGDFIGGMKAIGVILLDILLAPIRAWTRGILNLVNVIPGADKLIPPGIVDFAEKGFGTFQPEAKPQVRAERDDAKSMMAEQTQSLTDLKAAEKQRTQQPTPTEVKVDLTDKRTVDINNSLCIDGEHMSIARERHKQEIQERAGFKATPWQRRVAVEQGAAPTGRGA